MTMMRSGLASSISLASTRIAAISASNCSGISVGGRTNNCGAWTVATAATIFPIIAPNLSYSTNPTQPILLIHPFYAQLFQLGPQSVKVEACFAPAQLLASLFFLGDARLAGLGDFLGVLA